MKNKTFITENYSHLLKEQNRNYLYNFIYNATQVINTRTHSLTLHALLKHSLTLYALLKHSLTLHALLKHSLTLHALLKHSLTLHALLKHSLYMHSSNTHSTCTPQTLTHSTCTPQIPHLLYVQRWYVADLTCLFHMSSLINTTTYHFFLLPRLKKLDTLPHHLVTIYSTLVFPKLTYASPA